jgi:predicted branched-subunit amino acid permease
MTPQTATREGLRDGLSVVAGYIPFALALGAALGSSGVDPFIAWLSSPLMIAGAAQLVTVQMLGAGVGAAVVVATALVVNARHVLYSARMAALVPSWGRGDRWMAAYLLADPMFALAEARFGDDDPPRARASSRAYYFAASWTCWTGWLLLTASGVLLGDVLPAALPLDVAAALTFLLLLLPTLDGAAARTAAVVGGLVAALATGLPLGLGLLLGAATGVAAGTWVVRHDASAPAPGKERSRV